MMMILPVDKQLGELGCEYNKVSRLAGAKRHATGIKKAYSRCTLFFMTEVYGQQYCSKACMRLAAIICAGLPSIMFRSIMCTSFPSFRRAMEGEDGG